MIQPRGSLEAEKRLAFTQYPLSNGANPLETGPPPRLPASSFTNDNAYAIPPKACGIDQNNPWWRGLIG
jgi:hypothetical protein